jgi:hypothetical protein
MHIVEGIAEVHDWEITVTDGGGDVGRDGDVVGVAVGLTCRLLDFLEGLVQSGERDVVGNPAVGEAGDDPAVRGAECGVVDRDLGVQRREVLYGDEFAVVLDAVVAGREVALGDGDGLVGAPDRLFVGHAVAVLDGLRRADAGAEDGAVAACEVVDCGGGHREDGRRPREDVGDGRAEHHVVGLAGEHA